MSLSEILISEITLEKIKQYHQLLKDKGISEAGFYFRKQLKESGKPIGELNIEAFTKRLIQAKIPQIFAESGVNHDKTDWTICEESILGDISIHMTVDFYNDGGHYNSFKHHRSPISAHLAYVPGALLRSDLTGNTADLEEVTDNGQLNQQKFNTLYERRLLPQLVQINAQAASQGKLAAITMPGIGTGQFAGNFMSVIKVTYRTALESILEKHHSKLSRIDMVHYDPYAGDEEQSRTIGHIKFSVKPSSKTNTTGQLAFPEGASNRTHTLTSFVAWDHFSWPGNDFWVGSRLTDDGVKAASTNTMEVITGIKGQYNSYTGSYEPPQDYNNWQALVENEKLSFNAPISIVYADGTKKPISKVAEGFNPIAIEERTTTAMMDWPPPKTALNVRWLLNILVIF